MKHRPLVLSMILSVMLATLAPLSAFASNAGWFYQARCNGSTAFVSTSCLSDGITNNGIVLQASLPSYAPPEVNAGVDMQLVAPEGPKKGVGFTSLTINADLGKVSPCNVFAVLSFVGNRNRPGNITLVVPFDDFYRSCSKGCFDSWSIDSSCYPETEGRILTRAIFLVRGSYDYCQQTVYFGRVQLSQRQQNTLNSTIWTNKTTRTCGIALPIKNNPT